MIAVLETRTGKKVEMREAKTSELNPTTESRDMDEVVPYVMDKVLAALKPAMEAEGCNVKEGSSTRVLCKREWGGSERTGTGRTCKKGVRQKSTQDSIRYAGMKAVGRNLMREFI